MKENFLQFGPSSIHLERYLKLLNASSLPHRFEYSEGHHIYPKFAFGINSNIKYVSYRVHFLLHELIWKHFKSIKNVELARKAGYALTRMCGKNLSTQNRSGIRFSSRSFEIAKLANSESNKGSNNPMAKRGHTLESREKISKADCLMHSSQQSVPF